MTKIIALIVALSFSAGVVAAAEKSNKNWYENLIRGLKTKVQKKLESKNRVSAVAAVRGAKQGEDPKALYWKGGVSETAQKKLEAERKQLADAVQLVLDGDTAGAKKGFEEFIKANPDSVYLQEAKEAIEKLPGQEGAEVKPAAPVAKSEEKPAENPAVESPKPEEKKSGN